MCHARTHTTKTNACTHNHKQIRRRQTHAPTITNRYDEDKHMHAQAQTDTTSTNTHKHMHSQAQTHTTSTNTHDKHKHTQAHARPNIEWLRACKAHLPAFTSTSSHAVARHLRLCTKPELCSTFSNPPECFCAYHQLIVSWIQQHSSTDCLQAQRKCFGDERECVCVCVCVYRVMNKDGTQNNL